MSGGAFNYQHRKIKGMADDLRGIMTCASESGASCCPYRMNCFDGDCSFYIEASPHGKEAVAGVALILDVAARMAKAVEWWASGDVGEGDAIAEMNAALIEAVDAFSLLAPDMEGANAKSRA